MSNDHPENGDKYQFLLQDGDLVIFGTDGLFDNLCNDVLASIVKSNEKSKVQEIAGAIAKEAYLISKSKTAITPFAASAAAFGYEFRGGKEDDITVIVVKYKEMHAKL